MAAVDPVGRFFLAVALSDDARHAIAGHLSHHLGGVALPGSVAPPPNWHITLRFLGPIDAVTYDRVRAQVDEADLGDRFRIRFGSLGAFPRPSKATVLWIGVDHGAARLTELATVAEDAAVDAGLMAEERPFHPHLTISRLRPHQQVDSVLARVPPLGLAMAVDEVVMYRSHLGGGRPARYEAVERFPLR